MRRKSGTYYHETAAPVDAGAPRHPRMPGEGQRHRSSERRARILSEIEALEGAYEYIVIGIGDVVDSLEGVKAGLAKLRALVDPEG